MIGSIILTSVVYVLLPARIKSTDIKVALYMEDTPGYSENLYTSLTTSGSVYNYIQTDSLEELRDGVEAGKFECGFYIPEGFFHGYINGLTDTPKIIRYETASTTLGNAVTESVFSQIFKLCAADILYLAYDNTKSNSTLAQRLDSYLNGDRIFQIEDHSENRIIEKDTLTPVNIPIRQLSLLLIIFSGFLGLLTHIRDAEKGIYIALTNTRRFSLRLAALFGAITPILLVSIICCLVTYGNFNDVLLLLAAALGAVIFSIFPGVFFKKSSSLARLLPVLMLILIPIVVFA
jgi:hypothetical protein